MATRSEARVVEVSGEGDSRQMRVSNAGQWRPQLRPRRSSWWRSNEAAHSGRSEHRGEPPSKSTIRRSGHGGEGRGRGSKPARQLSHTAAKPVEANRRYGGSVMVQPQKMGGRWRTATSGHGSKMSRDGGSVMNKAMAV
ncbi:hypothetical protein TRIUR3_19177 [Triticum urartu]|uniref:Uncharacterized protein n=1 Tax=Triticum urartu TaxID=4572 RepID=M7Z0C7_TRIUA|nr:hypothetical protein TRIUR3_19177 [Triticum urartu]